VESVFLSPEGRLLAKDQDGTRHPLRDHELEAIRLNPTGFRVGTSRDTTSGRKLRSPTQEEIEELKSQVVYLDGFHGSGKSWSGLVVFDGSASPGWRALTESELATVEHTGQVQRDAAIYLGSYVAGAILLPWGLLALVRWIATGFKSA